ncbi:hypothetical protein GQ43DRAFT_472298 [Delitschia confertaspora ATCC 74209]|uniref:Uncharacterized protein n=1 Tax=Delitschia confertaspora ATCC 74209 TaxID=1513339 RepID=A0A9P4JPS8_9PLEO|nr:hypothetical protein GQ43DRAFT_472298 [Delitschia confertaspora ATCC 74209]
MKTSFVLAILSAALAIASPAAVSLNRSTREVTVDGNTFHVACIECPCEGFEGPCKCVTDGCCCT